MPRVTERRRTATPAYVCAAANLAAMVAMATVLAPGTTLVDEPARSAYIREHAAVWRLGWSVWVLAAISLLLFYRWWSARIGAAAAPLSLAGAGFAVDLVAETMLIVAVPERPDLARTAFLLTGGGANGLYTLAGVLLTRKTPGVTGGFALWTWAMWGCGAALSLMAALELPSAIAAATAALFALFIPWCVAMGRRLA